MAKNCDESEKERARRLMQNGTPFPHPFREQKICVFAVNVMVGLTPLRWRRSSLVEAFLRIHEVLSTYLFHSLGLVLKELHVQRLGTTAVTGEPIVAPSLEVSSIAKAGKVLGTSPVALQFVQSSLESNHFPHAHFPSSL